MAESEHVATPHAAHASTAKRLSIGWILLIAVGGLFAGLVIVYALLASRFHARRPTIARNYWQEINAARQVPDDQRAWPLYRDAALMLEQHESELIAGAVDSVPGEALSPELVELLERLRPALEMTREAASRPQFGYYLGDPDDLAAARAANKPWLMSSSLSLADENKMLIEASLGNVQILRGLARLLATDAQQAAIDGDGERVRADLEALVSMSAQLYQPNCTIVEQLVAIALEGVALDKLAHILHQHPDVLSEDQLRQLSSALANYRGGKSEIDFDFERVCFDDLLQRVYSDDGNGDGAITPSGTQTVESIATEGKLNFPPAMPIVATLIAGRAETRNFYNRTLDRMLAARQGPPWTWRYDRIQAVEESLRASSDSPLETLRYPLPYLMLPALGAACVAGERAVLQRDAARTAIALVLYHRRHGEWPERLEQLVPNELPAVPPDRYDGQPLRYVLRDGQPLLYCLGADHDDDGGRPADEPFSAIGGLGPLPPSGAPNDSDGDWILWPPLPAESQD